MQDNAANCGAYALKNALAALGIERTAAELESACGTSATNGTDPRGIYRAASKIDGCTPIRLREKRRDIALMRLSEALRRGRPVVISWNSESPGDHWTAVIGVLGDRYLVVDSACSELVVSLGVDELEASWVDGSYLGIII